MTSLPESIGKGMASPCAFGDCDEVNLCEEHNGCVYTCYFLIFYVAIFNIRLDKPLFSVGES